MENSVYKRLIKLVFNYWPYLALSTATAFVYVALNGISVWLTASLINNILSDFDKLVLEHSHLSSSSILSLNEKISLNWLKRFTKTLFKLQKKYNFYLLGGDISKSYVLSFSANVYGKSK